ncbi:unnamed protein product [Linum trigynum]|uniref:F-box domain-containing protein n=1 Tax=Linum trigynum TaxID=586398 RepID=A0AAV2FGV1_9ROSI
MNNDGIPEDLTTNILWRLPLGECIFRFRCVSKSWCDHLSDLSFIRRKLSSPPSSRRILIQCFSDKFRPPVCTL